MTLLGKVIALAAQAHQDQVDCVGQPYILHPLRLMARMESDTERMAAILHDVVEDTPVTLDDLRAAGIPEIVVEAIDALTHREAESYTDYVRRAQANPIARRVKLADLEDNMDVRRYAILQERDIERLRRYHLHWRMLKGDEK